MHGCIICNNHFFFPTPLSDYRKGEAWCMPHSFYKKDRRIICTVCSKVIAPALKGLGRDKNWVFQKPDSIVFSGENINYLSFVLPAFPRTLIEHKIEHLRNLIEINKFME